MRMYGHEILLSGIVGSRAYGIHHEGSDTDRQGIFVAPTSEFHGLRFPPEHYVCEGPGVDDVKIYEAAKWCRLALKCNPTIMELAWLPDELVEINTDWGQELRDIKSCFLYAAGVRNSYMGYATKQLAKLEKREDVKYTSKYARHLMRLCQQGYELYTTGRLSIRVENPHVLLAFGERVAAGDVDAARNMLIDYGQLFDRAQSPLGDRPDEDRVDLWLRAVRHAYWKESEDVYEVQQRNALIHAELLAGRTATGRRVDRASNIPRGW